MPQTEEYMELKIKDNLDYHCNDSVMRTGNRKKKTAIKPFQVFSFQNGSQKTRPKADTYGC